MTRSSGNLSGEKNMGRALVRPLVAVALVAGLLTVGAASADAGVTGCPCTVTNGNNIGPGSY